MPTKHRDEHLARELTYDLLLTDRQLERFREALFEAPAIDALTRGLDDLSEAEQERVMDEVNDRLSRAVKLLEKQVRGTVVEVVASLRRPVETRPAPDPDCGGCDQVLYQFTKARGEK